MPKALNRADTDGQTPSPELLFRKAWKWEARGASDAVVAWSEKQLGVKLPASYVQLVKKRNGGGLRLTGLKTLRKPPSRIASGRSIYHLGQIAGLHKTEARSITSNARSLAESADPSRTDLALCVPFEMLDEYVCTCFDYRECGPRGEPCISYIDPMRSRRSDWFVAPDFATVLRNLRVDFDGDHVFAVDEGSGRLEATLRALGAKRVRGCPWWGWDRYAGSNLNNVDGRCQLMPWTNGNAGDPEHPERPGGAQLLRVGVAPRERRSCLSELAIALGAGVELIHQAPDHAPVTLSAKPLPVRAARSKSPAKSELDPSRVRAAITRNPKLLKELIEAGLNANTTSPGGRPAIEEALREGRLKAAQALLEATNEPVKAEVWSYAQNLPVLRLLVAHGVPPAPNSGDHFYFASLPVLKAAFAAGMKPTERGLKLALGTVKRPPGLSQTHVYKPVVRLMLEAGAPATDAKVRAKLKELGISVPGVPAKTTRTTRKPGRKKSAS